MSATASAPHTDQTGAQQDAPLQGAARVNTLWRWPVKGLGGEQLQSVDLEPGGLFPFDRAFALENGPSDFDPDDPQHVSKRQFVCMVHQPSIARLSARWDEATQKLSIETLDGRAASVDTNDASALEKLAEELVEEPLRGPLRLRTASDPASGHGFTDVPGRWVALQNRASIDWLSQATGTELDPRRLRGNVLIEGWEPFAEEALVGATIRLGEVEIRIEEPINRCRAIDVNPASAERDTDLLRPLMGLRGLRSMGVYATVTKGGRLAVGDPVTRI
jgi:uncharacterized protein YcbX